MTHNPRFRGQFQALLKSDDFQSTMAGISNRLEETIRRMADMVLGTQKDGITPEFAKVLRAQVLHKGKRKIVLDLGESSTPLAPGAVLETDIRLDEPGRGK